MAEISPRIAIVDDDSSVLKALARLLMTRSFSASTYGSAADFIASLSGGRPECLIVDLQMPAMTGIELQHHLIRAGVRIPTIVITAHDETGARERCKSAGAIAYILKPIQDTLLFSAIDEALKLTRQ